jgi:hypothetical protein
LPSGTLNVGGGGAGRAVPPIGRLIGSGGEPARLLVFVRLHDGVAGCHGSDRCAVGGSDDRVGDRV